MAQQHCPICLTPVEPSTRYPRYLCGECSTKATSPDGRQLEFSNVDLSGGFVAHYADTAEEYPSHACVVRGVRCRVDEAYLGGIVIEAVEMSQGGQEQGMVTSGEQAAVQAVLDRITTLAQFLEHNPVPENPEPEVLYEYLARMKKIQGNTDNGVSMVACLLAKRFLGARLDMQPFDATKKPQGAAGLDIDERTITGEKVVAEIKTTVPYGSKDLGSAQKSAFEKDFQKLNAVEAAYKFFFVTDRRA